MQSLKFTNSKIWRILLISGIMIIMHGIVFSFSIAIPKEMENASKKEIDSYIERSMKKGHEEQIRAGKERYNRKIEEKKKVAYAMKRESKKRRDMIIQSRKAQKAKDEEIQTLYGGIYLISGLLILSMMSVLLYKKLWRYEVPENKTISIETRQALETSQSIMQKLKKKSPPSKDKE
jgi:hypothetical protein